MKRLSIALCAITLATSACSGDFALHSPEFVDHGTLDSRHVFNDFGCTGQNRSPALEWDAPPPGTKSFALMVHDPDAPTGGSGWWHWVVVDIPPEARSLPAAIGSGERAQLPAGARQLRNDLGVPAWGGPCPPVGAQAHRYVFRLYALKLPRLELPEQASSALAGYLINLNSIGSATLTGLYQR